MSWLLAAALVVKAFVTGTVIGVWIERRHRRRVELARVWRRRDLTCP